MLQHQPTSHTFLGIINYYCKFLPNLSNTLAPLYRLLQKNTKWQWGPEQHRAFQTSKKSLTSDCILTHFDPTRALILACDASPYGIGAVLLHRTEDGLDKPITFSSRTLAPAEKKYSQLEKEGLAVVFGVKGSTNTCMEENSQYYRTTNPYKIYLVNPE